MTCDIESGWTWSGGSQTSKDTCLEIWEDDKNTTLNDGCSSDCKTENGYSWIVNPLNTFSTWTAICGDELVVGSEQWDDKNTTPNDGCDSDCKTENGYSWVVNPPNTFSTWIAICGDELVVGSEQWDDKNTTPNDGCSSDCKTDTTEIGMKKVLTTMMK